MGPVGITVPAGIQHQLYSLSFVLLAQVLPVLSPDAVPRSSRTRHVEVNQTKRL